MSKTTDFLANLDTVVADNIAKQTHPRRIAIAQQIAQELNEIRAQINLDCENAYPVSADEFFRQLSTIKRNTELANFGRTWASAGLI